MEKITVLDKTFVKYIPVQEVNAATERVAQQINEDYKNDKPILLVNLNGAMIFAAELMQKLTMPCRISCIKFVSYSGMQSTHTVTPLIGLNEDLTGQRVIIVEDIVDTGETYEHLCEVLQAAKVKDVRMATMALKTDVYNRSIPVHYVGLPIPNKFVVGHGLDYDGWGRNLPDIYQVCE